MSKGFFVLFQQRYPAVKLEKLGRKGKERARSPETALRRMGTLGHLAKIDYLDGVGGFRVPQ